MGVRIYKKAGCKAMKNTNKKDQVSFNGEDRYVYTHLRKKCPFNSA